jgi:hypothetical protein
VQGLLNAAAAGTGAGGGAAVQGLLNAAAASTGAGGAVQGLLNGDVLAHGLSTASPWNSFHRAKGWGWGWGGQPRD